MGPRSSRPKSIWCFGLSGAIPRRSGKCWRSRTVFRPGARLARAALTVEVAMFRRHGSRSLALPRRSRSGRWPGRRGTSSRVLISLEPLSLQLRHTWTIARGSAQSKLNGLLSLTADGVTGFGEVAPSVRYGQTFESARSALGRLQQAVAGKRFPRSQLCAPASSRPSGTGRASSSGSRCTGCSGHQLTACRPPAFP